MAMLAFLVARAETWKTGKTSKGERNGGYNASYDARMGHSVDTLLSVRRFVCRALRSSTADLFFTCAQTAVLRRCSSASSVKDPCADVRI